MLANDKIIYAIVVTFNRKNLLVECLDAIYEQTRKPNKILIVNNASTDGTVELLTSKGLTSKSDIEILSLPQNIGGTGGFSRGIQYANQSGADCMWIMDDDALPESNALENLLDHVTSDSNIYGSIPVDGSSLSWRLTEIDAQKYNLSQLHSVSDLPEIANVSFLPFLGLLISKDIVTSIGLPDEGFFLAADDVEYCLRARNPGHKIIAVKSSRLKHQSADIYEIHFPFKKLTCLRLPPWKRYYDVRNRLFVSQKYYGMKYYYQTIPGSILRLFGTLLTEPQKLLQLKAFIAGMVDGIMGKKVDVMIFGTCRTIINTYI